MRTTDWNGESSIAPVAGDELNLVNFEPHDRIADGLQAAEGHHGACAVDGTQG